MKDINDILGIRLTPREMLEDEYLDKDTGLFYCKKCHTPRQSTVIIGGIHPSCICECQGEKREAELAEQRRREELNRIARLKSAGLQDSALRDYTFANDNGINPEMKMAHKYVNHWSEMKASSTGLLLWGNVGTGKSFFAGCVANALLDKGIPVLMTNFARILNVLGSMGFEDKNKYIDSFNQYPLLIIDDLGMERNSSEFALEQIFNVIDSRYRSKLPFIVTTNLTLDELRNPKDLAHSRIYDRVLERCMPLKINNQNIRQINRVENMKMARELLCS
ncbi:AAA family ATPase [Enterocloster aldenensis]|uniref:ATP-binding protein n=1 Tax=Enterocloster aldenensis TaxID=358742 RepID=UPI000E417722|nr:AAA family ATPase [Enterocloster aldenensis]